MPPHHNRIIVHAIFLISMFFAKTLGHRILVPPESFGPSIKMEVERRLRHEVEGTCHGKYGFIICVMKVESYGEGHVQDSYGYAAYNVKYEALVLKPYKGEVVDALVTSVNKVAFRNFDNRYFYDMTIGILYS